MSLESPFSFFSNNIKSNKLCFKDDSKELKDSSSDFFLIEDNKQYRTKQRMGFYNNGNSSQMKQYLDYFLNSSNPNNINLNSFEDKDKIVNLNSSSNKKRKNFFDLSFNEFINQNPINDNGGNEAQLNNQINEISEEGKDCCCPPPCVKSINSSFNSNNLNSSSNSNIFNGNSKDEIIEDDFDLLGNQIGQISLKEKGVQMINPNIVEKFEKLTFKY